MKKLSNVERVAPGSIHEFVKGNLHFNKKITLNHRK